RLQGRATAVICGRVQDGQPVEIAEALRSEREVGRVLHTAGASREFGNFRDWKPSTPVRGDEPRWTWGGGQAGFKRAVFGLTDAVGIRNAYSRTDDGIALPEHDSEMRPRRPPGVSVGADLPFCPSALQMAVVSERQDLPSATLTRHHVRKIVRHQGVADAETLGVVRLSRHRGMKVE